jgi:hypothetical protein
MKKSKQILLRSPEYYILLVVLFSGYTFPFNFNPIAIGLSAILIMHIIIKSRMAGLFIATLFLLVNIYMPFALLSEFRQFTLFNAGSLQLFIGFVIIGLNLFFSLLMIYKNIKEEENQIVLLIDNKEGKNREADGETFPLQNNIEANLSNQAGQTNTSTIS